MGTVQVLKTEDVLVRVMVLEKGGATDWHYHTEVSDFFVCLSGSIRIETRSPDRAIVLAPGQRSEVEPMTVHRVENADAERSEYLLVQGVGAYDFCRVE